MKKEPKVSVPFVAAQLEALKELRGQEQRIKTERDGYDELLVELSELSDTLDQARMPADRKAAALRRLVRIAALAQRTAEDCRCCRREWVGGDEDA